MSIIDVIIHMDDIDANVGLGVGFNIDVDVNFAVVAEVTIVVVDMLRWTGTWL